MIIIIFLSSKVSGVARKKTVLCLLALTREHRVACQALMMKETHFMDRSALFSSHLSLINLLASTLLRFFVYVLLIFTRIQSTSYIQFVWTGCYKPYLCHFKIDFQFPAIGRPPTKIHRIKTGRLLTGLIFLPIIAEIIT